MSQEDPGVAEVPRPAGSDEGDVTGPDLHAGLSLGRCEILRRYAVPAGQHVHAAQPGHVEKHAAADQRLDGVHAEHREASTLLGFVRRGAAVQVAHVGDVGQGVDVGPDVAAGRDQLARGGAAVSADHVAVAAHEGHPERRMVGRMWCLGGERLRQVIDFDAALDRIEQTVPQAATSPSPGRA